MAEGTIGNIWPYYAKQNIGKAEEKKDTSMGKDDFLKILVAQLKHQDPMQPLQDRDFIAQMAQFSSVEQMMNISTNMAALRQSMGITPGLIGKTIVWHDMAADGTRMEEMHGIVEAITFKEGLQYAVVGQKEVALDQIIKIREAVQQQ